MQAVSEHAINWIDVCSLSLAVLYGIARSVIFKQRLISRATGLAVANGIGLFPLILLVASTYYEPALEAVLQSNRVILSLAGIVALITILEDFLPEHQKSIQRTIPPAPTAAPPVPPHA
jgi:hypothetical protein